jgi:hypothetical protein
MDLLARAEALASLPLEIRDLTEDVAALAAHLHAVRHLRLDAALQDRLAARLAAYADAQRRLDVESEATFWGPDPDAVETKLASLRVAAAPRPHPSAKRVAALRDRFADREALAAFVASQRTSLQAHRVQLARLPETLRPTHERRLDLELEALDHALDPTWSPEDQPATQTRTVLRDIRHLTATGNAIPPRAAGEPPAVELLLKTAYAAGERVFVGGAVTIEAWVWTREDWYLCKEGMLPLRPDIEAIALARVAQQPAPPQLRVVPEPDRDADLEGEMAAHARPTWLARFGPLSSTPGCQLGGRAWLVDGEMHPCCPQCGDPLRLVVQLHPDGLPEGAPTLPGIVQSFTCDAPDCDGAWATDAPGNLGRVVDPAASGRWSEVVAKGRGIVGWHRRMDVPMMIELEDVVTDERYDELDALDLEPSDDAKLGGWPYWYQGREYPTCPHCETEMALLFQVPTDWQLDLVWGDGGMGHVTWCPRHPTEIRFGWAC